MHCWGRRFSQSAPKLSSCMANASPPPPATASNILPQMAPTPRGEAAKAASARAAARVAALQESLEEHESRAAGAEGRIAGLAAELATAQARLAELQAAAEAKGQAASELGVRMRQQGAELAAVQARVAEQAEGQRKTSEQVTVRRAASGGWGQRLLCCSLESPSP